MGWWAEDWDTAFPDGATLSVVIPVYNERYLVEELIGRVLDVEIPRIARIEVIVVDDGSTDGTGPILDRLAKEHEDRIALLRQENMGKGAAVRAGIERASGDLIVIQDADLEYDPRDLANLVEPFFEQGADVVYGSRFGAGTTRRVLYFRHSMGNRLITFVSNLLTDLNLTDVETCYKMFRAPILKSIPIRSNDFALEIELTAKAAKRGCRIFEVPISYAGRTYQEGKKITWRDGIRAFVAMAKFWLIDDLYKEDPFGADILHSLERTTKTNRWMADTIRPFLGDRVLEIGAGIGNITRWLVPRELYVASDINHNYLHYLSNLSAGKPYAEVAHVELGDPATSAAHSERFDTVVCLNVLEHVPDPHVALQQISDVLMPGGRVVLYVPADQKLYSAMDEALGHRCRYERDMLRTEIAEAGFDLEHLAEFNRPGRLVWWLNSKLRGGGTPNRFQLKVFDMAIPLIRLVDGILPGRGLGLVAVARKPAPDVVAELVD